MAQQSFKNPPAFGAEKVYDTWKTEVSIWRWVTDLSKDRQALAVALSLTGQARAKALAIDVSVLNSENGLDSLLESLDTLYLKDKVDLAYEAYSRFDTFRKTSEMTMADYILEFEHRYGKCEKYEMPLPEPVLAFKLLDSANLSAQERQLALTACMDLKLMSMKSALKRIFKDSAATGELENPIEIKSESAYYTNKYNRNKRFNQPMMYKPETQKGTNPLNRYGKRTRCAICQSIFHWAKDCEHRSSVSSVKCTEINQTNEEHCNFTLFTNKSTFVNTVFLAESYGCAVIDTACSRTVCGEQWMENYLSSLNKSQRDSVSIKPSSQPFRFGDGAELKSFKNCVIPAKIGNINCHIDVEVVKGDLPLLLSKESLKRANAVIDLSRDKVTMFQQPIQLQFTSSGHYCVNITNSPAVSDLDEIPESEILVIETKMTTSEKQDIVTKLHKQFGHASVERLGNLLKSAGQDDKELVEILRDVVDHCDICLKYKRQACKPVVGLPLASDFNETVALDLHQLDNNLWYLHIIDEFSRYSAGAVIKSKQSHIIVQKFIQNWIAIHGAPQKVYSDNGGEFNNREFHDMCENFNIEVKTTPAMSPWSNGLMERHNRTLTDILLRVRAERQSDWDTSLAWALMAKNSLCNVHGYSSHQLVYGKNPNLPSVLTNKVPALEGTTISAVVGNHIATLYSARKAFTQAENSERIRRALRKQIRPFTGKYSTGDKVYYKRPDNNEWKGPATVIGQDGVVVFARHGGMVVRVHQCRLRKSDTSEKLSTYTNNETNCENHMDCNSDNKMSVLRENDSELLDNSYSEPENDNESGDTAVQQPVVLKPGQVISYNHVVTGEKLSARILGRAGKATGKNAQWYNLEYLLPHQFKGVKQSVDLSRVEDLKLVKNLDISDHSLLSSDTGEHSSTNEANVMIVDVDWTEAKSKELQSWLDNKVFEEVVDSGQHCVSTKWICTVKDSSSGTVRKARLVARGFEEINTEEIQTDSPTCSKESLRMVLALIAQNKWKPNSMDIKTAFLQGQPVERDIFIRPPSEANCSIDKVWRLKKCVYGLNDASLHWYNKVKTVMVNSGSHMSKVDPALFYWLNKNSQLCGLLACHVDDFIWSGDSEFETTIIESIRSQLNVGKENSEAFKYVGIELCWNKDQILIHQNKYASLLTKIDIDKARICEKDLPLTETETQKLRSKVGQLLWIARQTRPDIIFDVCQLASCLKSGKVENLVDANKIIRRVHSDKVALRFKYLGIKPLSLVVFSDSSFGNLPDGGSQRGHLVFLVGENGEFSPLCWNSKKLRRVVRSSLAGETLAMSDAVDTGIFLATLYGELTTGRPDPRYLPLVCVTDCKSLCDAVCSTKSLFTFRNHWNKRTG